MSTFSINGRQIGEHSPVFVIAEAGVNHNGDLNLAHRLVDAAAEAAVDAVKFQTFDANALASAAAPKASYQVRTTGSDESQREMLRKLALSESAHVELKRHAEERGLIFLSSPFDHGSADFLERLGVPAFKVASGEITNHRFLAHLANKARPLLISTGMSDLAEVKAAVAVVRDHGSPSLALFHCTSSYPAPTEASNLRALDTLQREFSVPVGYSDHTLGAEVALAAVALGAQLIEKHLTLDRTLPGPDHAASMEPTPFRELVASVRKIESALGDGVKRVEACEREIQRVARKSLFLSGDCPAGHQLVESDLDARRPGTGISAARYLSLIGRRLRRDLSGGRMLQEDDLE